MRLYLRDDEDLPPVSCLNVTRSLVKVSEFRLTVHERGVTETWTPDVPRHLIDGRELVCHEAVPGVLWWTKGKGAILCDGIATDQETFGYLLNLSGPHAGRLSVNRNELLDYDEEWAEQIWAEGTDSLTHWPELDMGWLWELEQNSLPTARTVGRILRGRGMRVPLSDKDSSVLDLDALGWFHPDSTIVGLGNWSRKESAEAIKPWRKAVLTEQGITVHGSAIPASTLLPPPEPGTADLIAKTNGGWPALVSHACTTSIPLDELLLSSRRLRPASPALAPPPIRALHPDWVPDLIDDIVVQSLSGVASPRLRRKSLPTKETTHSQLVRASFRTGESLGSLVKRCARFAPFGMQPIEVASHHMDYVCTAEDVGLIHGESDDSPPLPPQIDLFHFWHRASLLNIPSGEFISRFSKFSWLGWSLPEPPDEQSWTSLTGQLVELIQTYLCGDEPDSPHIGWEVSLIHAGRMGIPFIEAEKEVADAATALRVSYFPRPTGSLDRGHIIPSSALGDFLWELDGIKVHSVDLIDLLSCGPKDPDELRDLVAELSAGKSPRRTMSTWP
ncbi:hypothetical protein GXW82_31230 [Streptacidiphilus sp. 4-A2]|nr:hypothetical protein [Streptacidiphilus sp. 4-A2]